MARRLPPEQPGPARAGAAASASKPEADELTVLHPELTLTIGGEDVTVREYDFWTAMDAIYAQPGFLNDAIELLTHDDRDAWEAVRSLFGRHAAYLKQVVAKACGRDAAWVGGLAPRDTDALLSGWWAVNGHFFLHEAVVVMRGRAARTRLNGRTSSPPSPAQGSATSTASGDTRHGS